MPNRKALHAGSWYTDSGIFVFISFFVRNESIELMEKEMVSFFAHKSNAIFAQTLSHIYGISANMFGPREWFILYTCTSTCTIYKYINFYM